MTGVWDVQAVVMSFLGLEERLDWMVIAAFKPPCVCLLVSEIS